MSQEIPGINELTGSAVKSGPSPLPSNDLALAIDSGKRTPELFGAMLLTSVLTAIVARIILPGAQRNGLNALVILAVLVAGWLVCTRYRQVPAWRKLCALGGFSGALLFALRDSEILNLVSVLLMIGFTSLSFLSSQLKRMKGLPGLFTDSVQLLFNYCFGGLMAIIEAPWRKLSGGRRLNRNMLRLLTGVFISIPFLVVFGLLFTAAETSFGDIFVSLINLFSINIADDLLAIAVMAYLVLGAMRSSFISVSLSEQVSMPVNPNRLKLGLLESGTVLGLLNAMFLVFVITQLPYFFGGQAKVTNTAGLAWSEYARKGFFELAIAVGLLVPTLLLFLSVTRTETARDRVILHAMCACLVMLCGVIIMSALHRMLLYTANFGLTEMRICVTAFIAMLAIILAILMVLSVRQQRTLFVPFVLIIGIVFTIALHVVNVQALVARDIISRKAQGLSHDINLLKSLSADAVPAILKSDLEAELKQEIAREIMGRSVVKGRQPGLLDRSWSYQRALALMR